MSKPFLCKLGFHRTYSDTVLLNVGTEETPIYMGITSKRCNKCTEKVR